MVSCFHLLILTLSCSPVYWLCVLSLISCSDYNWWIWYKNAWAEFRHLHSASLHHTLQTVLDLTCYYLPIATLNISAAKLIHIPRHLKLNNLLLKKREIVHCVIFLFLPLGHTLINGNWLCSDKGRVNLAESSLSFGCSWCLHFT